MPPAKVAPLPASRLADGDLAAELHERPADMCLFACNVGDGDAQVLLLPHDETFGGRRAIVVDAGRTKKVPSLLMALASAGLLPTGDDGELTASAIPLVVATHPHRDHIMGLAELLRDHGHAVDELWEPGYYHPTPDYLDMMRELETQTHIVYAQPCSGLRRFIGNVAVTVLSPSIHLRNRFDTYGVEINDASISLRIEYPAGRVIERTEGRQLVKQPNVASVVLGADAQTLSWSFVLTDFPNIAHSNTAAAHAIGAATGGDLLGADVFKVSHHASKHGVNLELVERIRPKTTIVSSVADGGSYNFPHRVAQEMIREALHATTSSGDAHHPDHELGIFYTADTDDAGGTLGTIAVQLRPRKRRVWRLGDAPADAISLGSARLWAS